MPSSSMCSGRQDRMRSIAVVALQEILWVAEGGVMMCGIFCVPLARQKAMFLWGAALLAVVGLGELLLPGHAFLHATVKILSMPVILLLWTRGKVIRRLAIYLCSIMYLNLPYLCIDFVFCWLSGQPAVFEGHWAYRLLRSIAVIAAIACLSGAVRRMVPGYQEIISNMQTKYFVIGCASTMAASLIQHSIEEIGKAYGDTGLAAMIIGSMIFVSGMFYVLWVGIAILDLFRKKYKEESGLKDKYLEITKGYVRLVRKNARETRKMRHDLQAHIRILSYYMGRGEYGKAQAYLMEMQDHMEQAIKKVVSVNHEIVDAVLQEARARGEQLHIRWEIDGMLPGKLGIGDFDLCTIFSNLLSNSIEACAGVRVEERAVCLEIRRFGEYLVIEIVNPAKEEVDLGRLGAGTSKGDLEHHGFGIANVKSMVKKNHGEIVFENRPGKFSVKILFFLEK